MKLNNEVATTDHEASNHIESDELERKVTELQDTIEEKRKEIEALTQWKVSTKTELEALADKLTAFEESEKLNAQLAKKINELENLLVESNEKEKHILELERQLDSSKHRSNDKAAEDAVEYIKRIEQLEEALKNSEEQLSKTRYDDPQKSNEALDEQSANQERIEELEEALRESVSITADREIVISQYESIIKTAEVKVCCISFKLMFQCMKVMPQFH